MRWMMNISRLFLVDITIPIAKYYPSFDHKSNSKGDRLVKSAVPQLQSCGEFLPTIELAAKLGTHRWYDLVDRRVPQIP
jgi:hypothetical protein